MTSNKMTLYKIAATLTFVAGMFLGVSQVTSAQAAEPLVFNQQISTPTPTPIASATPVKDNFQGSNGPDNVGPFVVTSYYVDLASGNDSNTCKSAAAPCQHIQEAVNKASAGDLIRVASGTYTFSSNATPNVVIINKSLTISGGWNSSFLSQTGVSIIDGANTNNGILSITGTVVVENFIVRNSISGNSGAIYIVNGNFTLKNSTLKSNTANSNGAGIYVDNGTLNVVNSTISGNTATTAGGGIYASNNSGSSVVIQNSTIAYNTAATGGGISRSNGTYTITNTIIANNTGTLTSPDCNGTIATANYNIIENTAGCSITSGSNNLNVDPQLESTLTGSAQVHGLMAGSPAINAGTASGCPSTDQRGIARPQGAGCDMGSVEFIGNGAKSINILSGSNQASVISTAFASNLSVLVLDVNDVPASGVSVTFTGPSSGARGTFSATGTNTTTITTGANGIATASTFTANGTAGIYMVTASASGYDPVEFQLTNVPVADPNGRYVSPTGSDAEPTTCSSPAAPCLTINKAIGSATAGDTVYVAEGTYTSLTGYSVVYINKNVTLSGGWNNLFSSRTGYSIVDGQHLLKGVITVMNASIDHFVVRNGYGGGVTVSSATFTINNSLITDNYTHGYYATDGGGINSTHGAVVINNSTIRNNMAGFGGGIFISAGSLTLNNATIVNNSATQMGGGILLGYSNGSPSQPVVTIQNSTIANNTANKGGGIFSEQTFPERNLTITNSIIFGNLADMGANCIGDVPITLSENNIFGQAFDCLVTTSNNDQYNTDPQFSGSGGFLHYYTLKSTSPAINAGENCLPADQRGISRPQGGACDIGSYEYSASGAAASFGIGDGAGQHTGLITPFPLPLEVYVVDTSGSPVSGMSVTFTAPNNGASGIFDSTGTNTETVTTNDSGVATSSRFTSNSQQGSYTVTAVVSGLPGSVNFAMTNAEWYVSKNGSDSNSCNTPITPCLTVNAAINKAFAGDAVKIASGTYMGTGDQVINLTKGLVISGGWSNDFTSQSGLTKIDGEGIRNGFRVDPSTSGSVSRLIIQNSLTGIEHIGGNYKYANVSLLYNNSGIHVYEGAVTLLNSTIGESTAGEYGYVIVNEIGDVTISYSTISHNLANSLIGHNISAIYRLNNVILSNNLGGCGSEIISNGHNIIDANCNTTSDSTDQFYTDPKLGPLSPFGYYSLLPDSPAINAGDDTLCPSADQRGVARPHGTHCDIGAFESLEPPYIKDIYRHSPEFTEEISVGYTVIFSEPVTGVDKNDFVLTTTGVTGASMTNLTGSGKTYTVTVNTGSGDGTIRLDVKADGGIVDSDLNPVGLPYVSGETYTVVKIGNILVSPAKNSYVATATPTFTWKPVTGALEYELQVDVVEVGFIFWEIDLYQSSGTSFTSSSRPLDYGTHYWRMRVRTSAGWGPWTPAWKFTLTPASPTAPTLASPATAAVLTDNTPDLAWNMAVEDDRYELQIDNLSTFASPEQTFSASTGVLNYTATTLSDGVWYWRVRTINYLNIPSAWSAYRSFTVDTTGPIAPNLSSPANAASVIGTPAFSWAAAATAAKYQFEYDNDADFSSPIYTSADLTTTSHTPPAMALGTYSWHVRGKDAAGNWGAWSAVRTVTILPAVPVAPTLATPVASAVMNDSTPDFTWNSVVSGNTYELEISNASTFATKQQTFAGGVGVLNYTATTIPDGVWYWHVRALNVNGVAGTWSAYRSFTVDTTGPVAPNLSSPANAASVIGTPAFSWAAATTATKYQFEYDNDADFSSPIYTSSDLTTTSHTPPAIALGTYSWHVRGKDAAGNWGAWSTARTVTILPAVPVAPTLATPVASAVMNDSTPDFTWNSVISGNTYELEISNASTFATKQQTFAGGVGVLNYTATTIPDGVWYWHVRALNVNGVAGTWSAYRSFTVDTTGPVAPNLSSPANAASVIGTPAFSWAAATTATKYQFEYDNDADFSSPIYTSSDLTTTSHTPPAMALGTYSWHVRGKDAAGNWGAWSTARTVTILPAVPVAPTLATPVASAVMNDSTPDFTWNSVISGNTYELEISNASTFATKQQTFAGGVGVLNYTATTIPDGVWYWHVRALNVNGVAGTWSAYRSFTVDTTGPVAPNLSSPANAASVIGTPAFSWAAAATAAKYQFEYDNDADFSSPIYTSSDLTTTSYTPPAMALGTYSWHVRGKDAAGNWGAWSTARTVTILPAVPVAPTLATPVASAVMNDSTPDFTWNSVVSGNTYELEISNASTFATKQQTFAGGVGVLNYTATTIPDGVWYWHVRALNVNGAAGTWSAYRSFTVDTTGPVAPNLSSPANAASVIGTPAFSWAAAATAAKYQFEYDNDADFSSPIYTSSDLTTTSHTPPAMALGTYSWHVRGKDAAGNWGAWSTVRTVTILPLVPVAPTLATPVASAVMNDSTPDFTWNSVVSGNTYELEISNASTFATKQQTFAGGVGVLNYTATTIPDGVWYWHVRALNVNGVAGTWSAYRSFTVDTTGPVAPNLSSPANAASVIGTPAFSWAAAATAAKYQFEYDNDADFSSPIYTSADLTTTSHTPPAIALGTYSWHVRGKDAAGNWGAWSTARTVTVIPAVPATPTLTSPANGSLSQNPAPTLNWDAMPNAASYQVQVDNNSTFSSLAFDDSTATNSIIPSPLADGIYYWRVRQTDILGGVSAWSAAWRVTIHQPIPVAPDGSNLRSLELPTDDTGLPTFTWGSVEYGSKYQIQVDDSEGFNTPIFDDVAETTMRTLTEPLAIGEYFWRVRAINEYDTAGPWSDTWMIVVDIPPTAPTLLLPAESTVSLNGEASFSWQDAENAENAEKYQIQVDDDQDFNSPEFDDTAAQTTRELPEPLTDGTYFWRVRGLNIYDTAGEWSEVRSFTVSIPPAAPTLLSPEAVSADETGLPTFEWEAVFNGVTYQLQVDNNADFNSPEFDDTAETTTRELAAPLENGTYYWRVRAIKADDTFGAWSLVWSFTVNVP